MTIKIEIYETSSGKHPFLEWLDTLDRVDRTVIKNRVERVKAGNLGNCKPIVGSTNLWEIVIDYVIIANTLAIMRL